MSDKERVKWLEVLLWAWGSMFFPLLLMALGAPVVIDDGQAAIQGLLLVYTIVTLAYLLILSWRGAYISGRKNR